MKELYTYIVRFMEDAECFSTLSSEEKKDYVIRQLKRLFGENFCHENCNHIDTIIETVIFLSKNKKIRVNLRRGKNKLSQLFGCTST